MKYLILMIHIHRYFYNVIQIFPLLQKKNKDMIFLEFSSSVLTEIFLFIIQAVDKSENDDQYEDADNDVSFNFFTIKVSTGYIQKFTNIFGLRYALSYSLYMRDSNVYEGNTDYFSYIDIAVCLYFSLLKNKKFAVWIGPTVSFNIGARSSGKSPEPIIFNDENRVLFGFTTGIHYMTSGFAKFGIGLEFYMHFADPRRDKNGLLMGFNLILSLLFETK